MVNEIAQQTGLLLEMVNLNVFDQQYVCAGDKRCLEGLRAVVDDLHRNPAVLYTAESFRHLVRKHTVGMEMPANSVALSRGKATVPLKGINVPFHSSLLAPMRELFRRTLADCIDKNEVQAWKLVGKWIPNVTGRPFALDPSYLRLVARLTAPARNEGGVLEAEA